MLPWSPLALVASFLLLPHLSGSSFLWLQEDKVCSSSVLQCGGLSININYPFRKSEDADHCGVTPIFCSKDRGYPGHRIVINSIEYEVKEINYEERKLLLLNSAFLGMSCPDPSINTTLDISPLFGYTDQDQLLNIYYGCRSRTVWPDLHGVQCTMGAGHVPAYYTTKYTYPYEPRCTATIRAALLRSVADELPYRSSLPLGAIWEGFEVSWAYEEEGRCSECQRSGGHCEYSSAISIEPNCILSNQGTNRLSNSPTSPSGKLITMMIPL